MLLRIVFYGDYKFLYVSPERISTRIFQAKVSRLNLCLVAIDEAHCISQWGYDFRPSYLKIASLREHISDKVPFLALTASATPQVIDDIMKRLGIQRKKCSQNEFRPGKTSHTWSGGLKIKALIL
jgi:ATP-dependent DNA helicase RecQ